MTWLKNLLITPVNVAELLMGRSVSWYGVKRAHDLSSWR
jgi:hypothetical protein